MNIAVVGAGFTGLSAAKKLVESGHQVTVFEKENVVGGLASAFQLPSWQWAIEKHYHHWFTNDTSAISLIKELGLEKYLLIPNPTTSLFYKGQSYPFNTPVNVLTFSPLTVWQRAKTGAILAYLKLLPPQLAANLEKYTAYEWLRNKFGEETFSILWKPLLDGKFGPFAKTVNMAWFWARIKKRTPKLGYLAGGYHRLLETLAKRVTGSGGTIKLATAFPKDGHKAFDATIVTAPSPIFISLFSHLPKDYRKRITNIPHLHALNMLLLTKERILKNSYWLNINEPDFPFIGVIQHTNFMDKKYYGGNHLTWVANYLPPDHKYLKMTKEELFKVYLPYLKKINPSFNLQLTTHNSQLFIGPFAQPVMSVNYSKIKPVFVSPIKNVYLANMDMVYPWDRGTNYAIELGYKVADVVIKNLT